MKRQGFFSYWVEDFAIWLLYRVAIRAVRRNDYTTSRRIAAMIQVAATREAASNRALDRKKRYASRKRVVR